tara:strand:- start:110 stop:835 length:726 start_codon:yes stop_codon:yes gene_type:complete
MISSRKDSMIKYFDKTYSKENSYREQLDGLTSKYKLNKYLNVFFSSLKLDKDKIRILELGAGDGEVSLLINKKKKFESYVATEYSFDGVKRLKEKGFQSLQMSAMNIGFKDNSFDVVVAFDVMHHVDNPGKMAKEILRVTNKSFLLIEANGACIIRKLLEKKKDYKEANENSYLPSKYKSFFPLEKIKKIRLKPFMFIPPRIPKALFNLSVAFSELTESIPIFKWQSGCLLIYGEKKNDKK